jgi:hypothetical protein
MTYGEFGIFDKVETIHKPFPFLSRLFQFPPLALSNFQDIVPLVSQVMELFMSTLAHVSGTTVF